ncbi:alpha/beta fold hydrolase [Geodermatophilus sp. SYSU D00766]
MSDTTRTRSGTQIRPDFTTLDGLSIRFARSEVRDEQALLFCPWPESLFAFAPTWESLSEQVQLFAVDLPGFGHSQGRRDLLSPRAMGRFVVRVADALDLRCPHVVGPDVGTSAVLFAAASEPDRFRSLVVGSGAASFPLELGEPLSSWVGAPDLDEYRTRDARAIVAATLENVSATHALPADVREDYLSAYEGDRFVESMRYVRAYPTDLADLRDVLPGVLTPVQIIAGARDTAIPPSNARYLHDRLPHSRLDVIDASHFTWEDDAAAYAAVVTHWWSEGHTAAGADS